jgi:hypothetical protein
MCNLDNLSAGGPPLEEYLKKIIPKYKQRINALLVLNRKNIEGVKKLKTNTRKYA